MNPPIFSFYTFSFCKQSKHSLDTNSFLERCKQYAPCLLRISLALVFLWFGINQLIAPQNFMGYLPAWTFQDQMGMGHFLHQAVGIVKGPSSILMINGTVEVILGALLLIGLFTRLSALLLSLHLLLIAFSLGYNDIAIRDVGLSLATFSVFLYGADRWCWQGREKKRTK